MKQHNSIYLFAFYYIILMIIEIRFINLIAFDVLGFNSSDKVNFFYVFNQPLKILLKEKLTDIT